MEVASTKHIYAKFAAVSPREAGCFRPAVSTLEFAAMALLDAADSVGSYSGMACGVCPAANGLPP